MFVPLAAVSRWPGYLSVSSGWNVGKVMVNLRYPQVNSCQRAPTDRRRWPETFHRDCHALLKD